ncbi:uncharacterized protein LOC143305799 isoform X2 [Osmia lignaria lignaria]|uniref:uncharacterized protein LOC143305799 isoform X2 n=1 Tax=Osmia lignaria lignaria TaxID=1437193 RepID=UPI00402BCCFE
MKEHKSISNDKLVSLEDGLIPNIETSYVKRMVRTTNGCKQLVQCIKFLLYFELLLFVGWAFYAILETYTVKSMEHKITDSIRDSESYNSHSRQLPYEETTIIPSNFLAEMENLLQTESTLTKTLEEQFKKQLHSVETDMNFVTTTEEPNLKMVEEDHIKAARSPLLMTDVPRLVVEKLEKDFETNESENLLPIKDALEKILEEQFKKHSVETDMNFVTTTEEPNSKKVEEDHIRAKNSPLLVTDVPRLVVEKLEKDFETNESENLLPIKDALEKILEEQFKKHSVETDMNFVTTTEEPNLKMVEEDHIKAARSPLLMTDVPRLVVEKLEKDFETNESENLLPIKDALEKILEEQFKKHSVETDMNFVTTTEEPNSKKVEEDHIRAKNSPLLVTDVPRLVVEELEKDFETNESENLLPIKDALEKILEEQFKKHSVETDMNFVTTTEEPNSKMVEEDHIRAKHSPLLLTNVPKLIEELEKDLETNESEDTNPDSSKSEDTNSDSSISEEPSLVWNFGFLPFPNIYNIKTQSESSPNDSDKSESTEIVEKLLKMDNHRASDGTDKELAALIDQILLSLILQEARRDGQIMNFSEEDMDPKFQDSTIDEQFYEMNGDDTTLMTPFQTDSGSEDWKDDSVYDDIIINRSVRENTNDRTPGDFNEQNQDFTPMIGDAKSGETAKQNFEPDMSSWISGTDEVYDPPVFTEADMSWAKSIFKRGIPDVSMNQELPNMHVENVEGLDERLVPQFPGKLNQNNVMSRLRPEIAVRRG